MLKKITPGGAKVLLIDDVGTENVAMIQALYARSNAGAEAHWSEIRKEELQGATEIAREVLKEVAGECLAPDFTSEKIAKAILDFAHDNHATAKAKRLSANYYVNYNHKSIGDCGSFTLFAEGVSMLAAKAIQQTPLYNGQEMSTRAVDMTVQPILDPMCTRSTRAIQDRWIAFYAKAQKPVAEEVRKRHPRRDGEDLGKYEGAVKYRTFDITRAFLPAGSTTNVSWHTTLRHANDHLGFLGVHPLAELRDIGGSWSELSCERYPSSGSFGAEATVSGVARDDRVMDRIAWTEELVRKYAYAPNAHVITEPMFTSRLNTGRQFRSWAEHGLRWSEDQAFFDTRPRGVRLPHEMTNLGNLHWAFLLDFGSFRDLQRHRYGVIRMPPLTLAHGFEPWYLDELPAELFDEAKRLLDQQAADILRLVEDPMLRQYYVAMGYRVGCYVTMGLPAFGYFAELRSGKTIHPTLRKAVLRMVDDFEREHPEVLCHIDSDPDDWSVRRGGQTIVRKTEA